MFKHIIIGVALLSVSASASAGIKEERRSVRIGFGDLNLAEEAGQQALDRRLRAAARKVCRRGPIHDLSELRDFRQCRDKALDGARVKAAVVIARAQSLNRLASAR